jgi:hypothetical protein
MSIAITHHPSVTFLPYVSRLREREPVILKRHAKAWLDDSMATRAFPLVWPIEQGTVKVVILDAPQRVFARAPMGGRPPEGREKLRIVGSDRHTSHAGIHHPVAIHGNIGIASDAESAGAGCDEWLAIRILPHRTIERGHADDANGSYAVCQL